MNDLYEAVKTSDIENPTVQEMNALSPAQRSAPETLERREIPKEKTRPYVTHNSGNNEWYTPEMIIEAARTVLGRIELDPASCEYANRTVKADKYFSIENDGLKHDWKGRVWMNPPYAAKLIPLFCKKLKKHREDGDVFEAIILVNNATETQWFSTLIDTASAIIFPRGRVRYLSSTGMKNTPLQGQAIVYIGERPEVFYKTFCVFGWGTFLQSNCKMSNFTKTNDFCIDRWLFTTKMYTLSTMEDVKMNAIEEIKRLKEQYERAKQPAIDALLKQKKEIDAQLEELGHGAKSSKRAPKKCRICGNPGHTARTCPANK